MGDERVPLSVECRHGAETTLYWLTIGGDSGDAEFCPACIAELRLAVQLARAGGEPLLFAWDPPDAMVANGLGGDVGAEDPMAYRIRESTPVVLEVEEGDDEGDVLVLNGTTDS